MMVPITRDLQLKSTSGEGGNQIEDGEDERPRLHRVMAEGTYS
jgi:hypothetical protein